jgi:acid stress-induced BolA-like protein IbaG/YrbA
MPGFAVVNMDLQAIKAALEAGLPDCMIEVEADGNKLGVTAVGEVFAGKSRVARQQVIYGLLNAWISSGEVHAVIMKTQTPDEA